MPAFLRIILTMAVLQLYSLYGWAQKPISDRSPLPGAKLSVSVPGGFYKAPVMVELGFEEKNAKIYYTLDGKTPSISPSRAPKVEVLKKMKQELEPACVVTCIANKSSFVFALWLNASS